MDNLPNAPQIPIPQVPLSPKPFFKTPIGLILIAVGVIALISAAIFTLKNLNINLPTLPGKQVQTTNQAQQPQILDPKVLFNKKISLVLKSSLLPKSLEDINLQQDQIIKSSYILSWDTPLGTVSGLMTASTPTQISYLYLSFLDEKEATASAGVAQKVTSELFLSTPKGQWGCKPIQNITYCENFWEDEGVKRGISVQSPISLEIKGVVVSFCEYHQNTDLYSWKSCTSEFANTGINSPN